MVLSCGHGLVLSVGSWGKTKKMEVGAGSCASLAENFGVRSVQDCQEDLCFEDVGAAAGDDCMEVAEGAVNVTKRETGKTGVEDKLEEGGESKLSRL